MKIRLPKEPDAIILKRLIRSRQFLEHANGHASGQTEFDLMVAVHDADNAIELLFKIIADHVEYESVSSTKLPDRSFPELLGAVTKFLKEYANLTLSNVAKIRNFHDLRNVVQHDGVSPSDIERTLATANKFFEETCEAVFGINRIDLKISSIVNDAIIKRHISAAEIAIENQQFEESVRSSRNAFEEALYKYRKESLVALVEVPARLDFEKIGTDAAYYSSLIAEELDTLRLKIDANRLNRFRDIVGHLPSDWNAGDRGNSVLQREWEKRDADFCYSFVTENILRWQSDEFEPLYERNTSDHRREEIIGNANLSDAEHGCSFLGDDCETELFYTSREIRDQLEKIKHTKNPVTRIMRYYKKGILTTETICKVQIKRISSDLLTHDPIRWKVVVCTARVPFTFQRKDYEDGKVISKSPNIKTCTKKELEAVHAMDKKAAKLVIDARIKYGKVTSKLLRKIGLSEKQTTAIEMATYT